jgi:two-component system sensor histidine kinase KdpD
MEVNLTPNCIGGLLGASQIRMNRRTARAIQFVCFPLMLWATAFVFLRLRSNRATASMSLLLEVLAIATLGDGFLAIVSSTVASLAFSFYFIEQVGTFRVTTVEGLVTFGAMVLTAFTGSRLSIGAQRKAQEAIRRREEMERLNQLGRILLSSCTLAEAGQDAAQKVVELFGLKGAVLRVAGASHAFQAGTTVAGQVSIIPLNSDYGSDVLELHGPQPSEEVSNAIASLIRLVLERARSAEERAGMESIRKGEEFRTTVLNAMAHNLRTPLTSIKAAASMLRASGRIPSAHERDMIVVIDEEADRLDQLISESLALAKLEARQANPQLEECRIQPIIERVAARMSRYFGRRDFIIEIPEDLPAISGDSFLFEQMLVQVVDNAWKYSQPGAPIRISAEASARSIVLTIWNRGNEIPEDERARIFDKFYRGRKDRRRVEGSGLGLAIAKTIAEACRGKMWLDIEPQGPAFRFELPLETGGRLRDREQHHITH